MKIEKVNDTQLRWSLDREDMVQHKVNVSDFLAGTPKARLLFQEAMKQAEKDLSFQSEGYMLYCQLQEFSEEKVIFSITRKEQIPEVPHLICEFEDLDQVIAISELLSDSMELENSLYKLDGSYMLFLDPKKGDEEQLKWCTINITEFTDVAELSGRQRAYLREHGECILREDALQRLKEIA